MALGAPVVGGFVAHTSVPSSSFVASSGSLTINRTYLACIHAVHPSGSAVNVSSVTGGAITWSRVGTDSVSSGGGNRVSLWRGVATATLTPQSITANLTATVLGTLVVVEWGSSTVRNSNQDYQTAISSLAVTLPPYAEVTSAGFGLFGADTGNVDLTAEDEWTPLFNVPHGVVSGPNNGRLFLVYRLGTIDNTVRANHTASTAFNGIAIEVQEDIPPFTLEGYRLRADDDDEAGASWEAAQDTPATVAPETNIRIRVLIDFDGDPGSTAVELQSAFDDDAVPDWETVLEI